MLHEFLVLNRESIIEATRGKAERRLVPPQSANDLHTGVPMFLDQLGDTLRLELGGSDFSPSSSAALATGATRHGGALLALGFNVSEVVHVYGDICQAVTELAVTQNAPVTVDEFRILNRSLDTAIAEAVTEHARLTADRTSQGETERLGQLAHELRNHVHTALLAFAVLRTGTVAVNGNTGTVLGRSLTGLRALVESTVAEVRLSAKLQARERMLLAPFLEEVATSARLLSDFYEIRFVVQASDPALAVDGDRHLLASAVTNLLQNAFKFSRPGTVVTLRTRHDEGRVLIEVEDGCGGIPDSHAIFQAFTKQRGKDRSGLGLGLSIARQAIRAHGGELRVRNVAGAGCIFTIDLPVAAVDAAVIAQA